VSRESYQAGHYHYFQLGFVILSGIVLVNLFTSKDKYSISDDIHCAIPVFQSPLFCINITI
jgi:hypothetical protein